MATLTLTVLRCPDTASAEQRVVQGGELTIGRGSECGWSLADPLKSLSRNHCRLEYFGGAWQVLDLSVNGTFVNFSTTPIGRDVVQVLRHADRLRLGDYEIEVGIEEHVYAPSAPSFLDAASSPMGAARRPDFGAARLPGLDEPIHGAASFGQPLQAERSVPDHSASSADAYVPPAVVAAPGKPMIPDDWYRAPGQADGPAAELLAPAPTRPAARAAAATQRLPEPDTVNPFGQPAAPLRAPPLPAAADALPSQALPTALAAPPMAGADMRAALAALMAGGDLPPDLVVRAAADPEAALRNAGALLRAAVAGMRALLIARGSVKREFRIEQTMLRQTDNNPLKFAASDEQALASLLDPRTPALRAIQESVNDLTLHQVAALAATQAAAKALLERLGPSKLEAEDSGGGLMPGAREKRLWDAYKRRHAKLLEQFEDDFESAFGTAFARAYEQAAGRAKG